MRGKVTGFASVAGVGIAALGIGLTRPLAVNFTAVTGRHISVITLLALVGLHGSVPTADIDARALATFLGHVGVTDSAVSRHNSRGASVCCRKTNLRAITEISVVTFLGGFARELAVSTTAVVFGGVRVVAFRSDCWERAHAWRTRVAHRHRVTFGPTERERT